MAKGKPGRPSAAHAMGAADKIAGTIGVPAFDPEKILGAEETDGEEVNDEPEAPTEDDTASSPETSTEGVPPAGADGGGVFLGEPIPLGKGLDDDEEEAPPVSSQRPKPLGVKQQSFVGNIAFLRMMDNEIEISSKVEKDGFIITSFQEFIDGADFIRVFGELFPERAK